MIDDTKPEEAGAAPAPAEETGFSEAFRDRLSLGEDKTEAPAARAEPEAKAEGDDSQGSEQTPPPAEETPPAEGTSGHPAPAADPWEGLTPEQRQRVDRLQASERSQRGRVGALTKKVLRLEGTAPPERPASAPSQQSEQPPEGGDSKSDDKLKSLEDRINAAAKDFPESVGPVKEIIDEVRRDIEAIKGSVSKVEVEHDAAEIAAALAHLEDAHPDFRELAADDGFLTWVKGQPASVVKLANSFDAREVSLALTLYKAENGQQAAPPPSPPPPPPPAEEKGETETDARRRRQLEGSRDTPSRGAVASGRPNDFSSAFAARLAEKEAEGAI